MRERPKPCPFCGGEAKASSVMSPRTIAMVYCDDCGAEGPSEEVHRKGDRIPSAGTQRRERWEAAGQNAIDRAIARWNAACRPGGER